jgi:hypothetical protein
MNTTTNENSVAAGGFGSTVAPAGAEPAEWQDPDG